MYVDHTILEAGKGHGYRLGEQVMAVVGQDSQRQREEARDWDRPAPVSVVPPGGGDGREGAGTRHVVITVSHIAEKPIERPALIARPARSSDTPDRRATNSN